MWVPDRKSGAQRRGSCVEVACAMAGDGVRGPLAALAHRGAGMWRA